MPSKKIKEEMCNCPVGSFIKDVEKTFGKKSNFFDHITRSKIEVLKAIRSLVDERIEILGEKRTRTDRKKMTNIEVD